MYLPRHFSHNLRMRLPVLLVVLCLFLQAGAQSVSLSARDRVKAFQRVWRLVNDRYYDPNFNGVDWQGVRRRYQPLIERATDDEQFYDLLEQMVGELRDAHTRVRNPFKRRLRENNQAVSTGIIFFEVEGQPVVTGITPQAGNIPTGITPGMQLLAIDNQPLSERMAEISGMIGPSSSERASRLLLYRNLLDGLPDTSVSLTLSTNNHPGNSSQPVTVTALRRLITTLPQAYSQRLASGFGYIQLTSWKPPAAEMFRAELEKLRDVPGLIIDLRNNGGGSPKMVLSVGSLFASHRVSFGQFIRRSGKPVELAAGNEKGQMYAGPVVILVNEGSGSGSELFAAAMQENGMAIVIGQQSCGCVLAAEQEKLPGGGELYLSILDYRTARGRRLEGEGVVPDRTVPLKLADLRRRHDATLTEAEKALKEMTNAKAKAVRATQR